MKYRTYIPVIILLTMITHFNSIASSTYEDTNITTKNKTQYLQPLPSKTLEVNETIIIHRMNVKIHLDNSLEIGSTLVLANNGSDPMSFFVLTINKTIDSVFCTDLVGSLEFTWVVNPTAGNLINISFRYPIATNDIYAFTISYKIRNLIFQVEGDFEYSELDYEISHLRITNTFILEMSLPIYADLIKQEPLMPYFPNTAKIIKENDIIMLRWELSNRSNDQMDFFMVRFVHNTQFLTTNNRFYILYFILTLFGGLILGASSVILFYSFRYRTGEKKLVSSLLSKNEQEIIKAINLDGGISTQRRISEKTGYSRSKVSKILANLEKKDVLERSRWGRTNKITITNDSFKQLEVKDSTKKISKDE